MPAYKRRLINRCRDCLCLAEYEVLDFSSKIVGDYCGLCADRTVKELDAAEKKMHDLQAAPGPFGPPQAPPYWKQAMRDRYLKSKPGAPWKGKGDL